MGNIASLRKVNIDHFYHHLVILVNHLETLVNNLVGHLATIAGGPTNANRLDDSLE